ncbi:MAG: DEAD/DEAH box helicase family protein [Candidatus Thiodiazotropha sp. (ex Dulcina madagascariensis)]|nr:DEAD/DEAH box helicase family protein [Candidatus Thiodiazotropha sp. (ex Dulcina madagascariensis)]
MNKGFLSKARLLKGPWQAFERDVARLMLHNGFEDVRLVGGTGDHGADILGVKGRELWVFQCKHTTSSPPPKGAVTEVIEAARFYKAHRMVVAVSRQPSDGFHDEVAKYRRHGLKVEVATPERLLKLMTDSPEYGPARRVLRDYQQEASERLREALVDTGRGQVVLATGLGKTIVMAETVADLFRDNLIKHGRALVLAHTKDLVEQLHQAFWYQLPRWVQTQHYAGGEVPQIWDGLIFATVQGVVSNIDKIPPVGLILVDEAHHIGADTFQRVIEELTPPMLGGVTATPWRGDGYDLDQILGAPVVRLGIAEGLQRGFLSEVDYQIHADNVDWEFVQSVSENKYSLSQLNRRLIIPTRDNEAARMIREVFDAENRRSAIVFSPTILHANAIAGVLRQYGFRAEAISGELAPRERETLMARFRAGELDIITSVDLFNEGVDVPDVDLIVFMRATHSRRIFVQQLGRGLRISKDKDRVVVLDFVTDLRRVAEVIELDGAVQGGPVERLGLGGQLISFRDARAGDFLREWMLDQASLFLREDDPQLELPHFEYPVPPPPGGIQ